MKELNRRTWMHCKRLDLTGDDRREALSHRRLAADIVPALAPRHPSALGCVIAAVGLLGCSVGGASSGPIELPKVDTIEAVAFQCRYGAEDAALANSSSCPRAAGDYVPGTDAWPECISDSGTYQRIQATVSSIARIEQFERIAALLFPGSTGRILAPESTDSVDGSEKAEVSGSVDGNVRPEIVLTTPDASDFLTAREIYQTDEGLDSRVVRRYDPHFSVPEDTNCGSEGTPAAFPEYCVGPARLQPILLDAFGQGLAANDDAETRVVSAARIEAALLWFLYASVYKEVLTCTDKAQDCDSGYAYYAGGVDACDGSGLGRYIARSYPLAHQRAWEGILAVRCWRDLDSAPSATDLALRDRAAAQLDRAVLSGMAAIVRQRLEILRASSGLARSAHQAFVSTLGPVLELGIRTRDAAAGTRYATLIASSLSNAEIDEAISIITAQLPCP